MLKIILSVTFVLILTDVVRCKPDYIFNYEVDGWLKHHTIPATWEEALLRCHYEGAVLASPLNEHLADALHAIIAKSSTHRPIFLGTHALYSEADFFSVEGVPLSEMPTKWGSNSEGPDVGDCLTMHSDGQTYYMHSFSCTERLPFVCYKKLRNDTILNTCGTFDNNYHYDQRTGSCYKLHQDKQKWSRAFMICAAEGGYLAILNDKEEASIIWHMFPHRESPNKWESMHIGLRAWKDDRTWLTIHGESLENVYNSWEPRQPDNKEQTCGNFIRSHAGALDDGWCDHKMMFVCEKDPTTTRFEEPIIENMLNLKMDPN